MPQSESAQTESIVRLEPEVASTWLIALRTAMVAVGLLASTVVAYFYGSPRNDTPTWVFSGFALLFFLNGVFALWARSIRPTTGFITFQLLLDCLIVCTILMVTGGESSPFVFLFLPLQMIASTFLQSERAVAIGVFASASYLGFFFFNDLRFSATPEHTVALSRLALQWVGVSGVLFLVHRGTTRIRSLLIATLERANASSLTAKHLEQDFSQLINGLSEAVLAVNEHGVVTAMNGAGERLFCVRRHEILGKTVHEASEVLRERCGLERCFTEYAGWDEIALQVPDDDGSGFRRVLIHRNEGRGAGEGATPTFYLFQDVTQLRSVEEQLALQEKMARALSDEDKRELYSRTAKIAGFVGESPVMQRLFQLIDRVSDSDATVLVAGESGTGKELVAKAIHLQSQRSGGPFIAVNCGAIPEALLESELFGHKKGSFTGAIADHPGMFLQANGGTIFLDEIGEMPLAMQAKLLRAIQEKTIRAVGARESERIDVRIIAATNRDLRHEVLEGRFREDLYYRLNVIQLQLPPLRERREDIPLLIQSILKRLSKSAQPPLLAPQTLQFLMNYGYPGNVRELENILERAMVLGGEAILPEHLPESIRNPEQAKRNTEIIIREDITFPVELDQILAGIEQHYLHRALQKSDGVKKHAAELLGMNFRSFRYRLQKFGLGDAAE